MSVKILSDVWNHSKAKNSDLLLLLALADAADDDGVSVADIDDLAHKTRLNVEETKTRLCALEAGGVLRRLENVGSRGNDFYQIIEGRRVR